MTNGPRDGRLDPVQIRNERPVRMEEKAVVEVSVQDGITVVSLDAATISTSGIDPIAQTLRQLIDTQHPQKMIIDFTRVRFLSSMMLGLLVDTWRRMKEYGGVIRICGIDPQLTRVFRITHLDRIFEFSPDLAGAAAAMKASGAAEAGSPSDGER